VAIDDVPVPAPALAPDPTPAESGTPPMADKVEHTGLALVHEGEYIVPAAGSEALLSQGRDSGTEVHYWFPVEVELVGDVEEAVVGRVVHRVFAELDRELSSRS
jgi:hypothetical protein